MKGGPIHELRPLKEGMLEISLENGNSINLDMSPKFKGYRFGVLSNPDIFKSVDTDGNFIRWYKDGMPVAELAFGEIMKMTLGEV